MITREEYLKMALTLGDVYRDSPFSDENWVLVRHRANKRAFAFTYVREGVLRAACKKGAPLLTRPSPAHPFPLSLWPPPCA